MQPWPNLHIFHGDETKTSNCTAYNKIHSYSLTSRQSVLNIHTQEYTSGGKSWHQTHMLKFVILHFMCPFFLVLSFVACHHCYGKLLWALFHGTHNKVLIVSYIYLKMLAVELHYTFYWKILLRNKLYQTNLLIMMINIWKSKIKKRKGTRWRWEKLRTRFFFLIVWRFYEMNKRA